MARSLDDLGGQLEPFLSRLRLVVAFVLVLAEARDPYAEQAHGRIALERGEQLLRDAREELPRARRRVERAGAREGPERPQPDLEGYRATAQPLARKTRAQRARHAVERLPQGLV